MAVSAAQQRTNFTGDGSTTAFAYGFHAPLQTDIAVYLNGTKQTSGYSVTGAGSPSGGTIVFTAAPGSGVKGAAVLDAPLQRSDVVAGRSLQAATFNGEFDALWRAVKQVGEMASRAIQVSPSDASALTTAFSLTAGRGVKVNSSGDGFTVTAHDPDDTHSLAQQAGTNAQAALDAVDTFGGSFTQQFSHTLVSGTHEYLLPVTAPAVTSVHVYLGMGRLRPGTDYALGDALGVGRTLVLLENGTNTGGAAVTSDGSGTTHKAGEVYWGWVNGASVEVSLHDKSVIEQHYGDASIPARALKDLIIEARHVVAGALGLDKLTGAGMAVGSIIRAGAANAVGALAQGSAYQFLRSSGIGAEPVWTGCTINLGSRQMSQEPAVSGHVWNVPGGAESVIRRIDLTFTVGVALSGADSLLLQVGTGTSVSPVWVTAANSYAGRTGIVAGAAYAAITTAFLVAQSTNSAPVTGYVQLRRQYLDSNTWHFLCLIKRRSDNVTLFGDGEIVLPDGSPLKQVRVLASGANTFSAGFVFAEAHT